MKDIKKKHIITTEDNFKEIARRLYARAGSHVTISCLEDNEDILAIPYASRVIVLNNENTVYSEPERVMDENGNMINYNFVQDLSNTKRGFRQFIDVENFTWYKNETTGDEYVLVGKPIGGMLRPFIYRNGTWAKVDGMNVDTLEVSFAPTIKDRENKECTLCVPITEVSQIEMINKILPFFQYDETDFECDFTSEEAIEHFFKYNYVLLTLNFKRVVIITKNETYHTLNNHDYTLQKVVHNYINSDIKKDHIKCFKTFNMFLNEYYKYEYLRDFISETSSIKNSDAYKLFVSDLYDYTHGNPKNT